MWVCKVVEKAILISDLEVVLKTAPKNKSLKVG